MFDIYYEDGYIDKGLKSLTYVQFSIMANYREGRMVKKIMLGNFDFTYIAMRKMPLGGA